ncbi:MAG TPA: orotate phosphoribosyltransferase [Kiritimatiellia bacterium]|nr:orotate phosphoribosyltransferase [Kiritimatiellia bacterium]HRU69583.1 orotate phosphoribosyltransferase [Kiritimatiellia bacterium]
MNDTDVLKELEETGALLNGHFELRSGLHSNRFFQCANVLRYPRIAGRLCEELVTRCKAELDFGVLDGVISPALGGILVGHEVARVLDTQCVFAEKQEGKLVMRRFTLRPGQRYVVAEDVITRGGRVQETIDIVKAAGADVAAVLVLVDRSAGQARFDFPTFSLLQMAPEVWVPAACPLCARNEPFVHPGS